MRSFIDRITKNKSVSDWQLTYSTLMMVLMIFFIILYTYFYSEGQMEFLSGRVVFKDMSLEKVEKLKKYYERAQDFGAAKKLQLVFETPLLYDSGSAQLKATTAPLLDKLSEFLRSVDKGKILVEGHTDNVPLRHGARYSSNRELSQYRALSIVYYFSKKGIDPKRLVAMGWGSYKPLYPNDTPARRAKNRRVEILLSKEDIY